MPETEVVIVGGARTPQGRFLGALSSLTAVELGAHAIRAALERSGVEAADVDRVVMGQVLQAGCGQNPARQAAVAAGVPWSVPAVTVNKVCLSGIAAVTDAARLIRLGEASVVVAGGQESMSNAPHLLPRSRTGTAYGEITMVDHAAFDGLTDAFGGASMGALTDAGNEALGVTRAAQDEVALASHRRAVTAREAGVLEAEIAPVAVPVRRGEPVIVSDDEGVRSDSTAEALARLRPAFSPSGTVTAGNSSPLSDGASALVVASRTWAEERGLPWLALVGASGHVAGPDASLHSQPSHAVERALGRAGWTAEGLDVVEINEAFASVAVHSVADLGIPSDRVNADGGAIALGHPLGSSGARIVLHAALALARRGGGRAAAALCGGGGQGDALLLSR